MPEKLVNTKTYLLSEAGLNRLSRSAARRAFILLPARNAVVLKLLMATLRRTYLAELPYAFQLLPIQEPYWTVMVQRIYLAKEICLSRDQRPIQCSGFTGHTYQ